MGKVIKHKIQGMSWLNKTGLVLLLTLATSIFMYNGWYKPLLVQAATVTYGVTVPSTASTGIDGAAQMPSGGASITTSPTVRGNISTTLTTSGASYRPTSGMANGTAVTLLKLYSPTYATAQTITAPSGSFAIRGYNSSDRWTFHIYSHNPAGTAGNKTLMYSSNTTTSGTGSTVTVTPTYTLVNSSMPAGYKLLVEVVYTPAGTTYTPRVYLDGTASSSWCRLTVTETAAATGDTLTASANTAIATSPQLATAANVLMQRFQVAASANTIELSSLTINDPGTATLINNVKVYIDTVSQATLPGTAVLIGNQAAWNGASTAIVLNQGATANRTVTSGTPKFIYIVYDMNSGMATLTVQSQVTAVGALTPDTGASALTFNSTAITLSAAPTDTLTVGTNTPVATAASDSAAGVVMQRVALNSNANGDGQVILSSVTIDDSTATATTYANAKIYIASTASTTLPGTAVMIGSQASFTGVSTTIPLTGGTAADRTVTTTTRYLYVVYDMSSGQATKTAQSRITAVGVSTPDTGATGLTFTSNSFTLTSAPIASIQSCSGCHGYTTTFNDGTARNVPAGQFQGSHNNHVIAGSLNCAACHTIPATTTSADFPHANGTINMASPINGDAGAAYTKGTSFAVSNAAFSGGTCSSTKCHGTTSPAWGNNSAANIDVCTKCHGTKSVSPATDLQKAPTAPATAAHNVHLAGSTIGKLVVCGECHQNVTAINSAGHMDGIKTIQYNGPVGFGIPASVTPANTLAGCATTWCHGGNTTLIPQNKPTARTAPVWGTTFGTTSVKGDSLGAASTNTGSGRCARCHGYPPATSSHNGKLLTDCISCHPHVNAAGTGFTDPSIHIDGKIDGGGSCTDCHDTGGSGAAGTRLAITTQFGSGYSHHYQGAAAVDGKACYACHWESDSAGSTTAYHQGSAGGTVDLVIWNTTTRPTTYTAGTTAQTYVSGGATATLRTELAKINNHCLGCHNDTNKTTQPFSASGDTKTPTAYSWEALSPTVGGLGATAQSIAAKYSDTTTTLWGKFSGNYTNAKSSQTKAFSAHGNAAANQRGWSTLAENAQGAAVANYPNTSGTGQVLCFDCHNSHGSDTSTVTATTSYDSPTAGVKKGGILKQTTAGKGGYTAAYKPLQGGSAANHNVYNAGAAICFDCHNSSAAGATTPGGSTPWGYGTYGATQAIFGYSDNAYFGNTGVFAKGQTYTYLAGLNVNRGGHFGASSALTTATANNMTIGGVCTPCHDPHGVSPGIAAANRQYAVPMLKETFVTSPYKMDASAVNTNHGGGRNIAAQTQAATAGYHIDQNTLQAATTGCPTTALKWNFATSAATLNTLTDTQFAGLCMKCHAKASINGTAAATSANWKTMTRIHNSVKGWASTGGGNAGNTKHAYTCSKCHSTHNSNLPRLLVTNCLDARHKNRSATAVTPTATTIGPFSGSNNSGNGLGRFPGGGSYAALGGSNSGLGGPWFFGTAGTAATQACHDSTTAGGTFDPAGTSQQWNTKSLW